MREYHFGVGTGKVDARRASQLNRIAQRHNGCFVAPQLPEGPRYWFAVPTRGFLHDWLAQKEILAEAGSRGLWPL